MGVGEGGGNRAQHVGAFLVREDAPLHTGQQLCKVETVNVLHDQVRVGAVGLEVVDRHDVGVGEKACRPRFCQGLLGRGCGDAGGALGGEQRDALDGNATLEPRVPAGADGSKATCAATSEHTIAPEERLLGNGARAGLDRAHGALCGVGAAHGVSSLCVCGFVFIWPRCAHST